MVRVEVNLTKVKELLESIIARNSICGYDSGDSRTVELAEEALKCLNGK